MRRSSIAAAVFMILSGAALARVGHPTEGKDVPYANMTPANGAVANQVTPSGNALDNRQSPVSGDQKTEAATPKR